MNSSIENELTKEYFTNLIDEYLTPSINILKNYEIICTSCDINISNGNNKCPLCSKNITYKSNIDNGNIDEHLNKELLKKIKTDFAELKKLEYRNRGPDKKLQISDLSCQIFYYLIHWGNEKDKWIAPDLIWPLYQLKLPKKLIDESLTHLKNITSNAKNTPYEDVANRASLILETIINL